MEKTQVVKKLEEMDFNVIEIFGDGTMVVAPKSDTKEQQYCDRCHYLKFMPDPDPDDWFRDDDQKAICQAVNKTIQGSLEFNELTNIPVPSFCPKCRKA